MGKLADNLMTIFAAIIGLAIVSVIISRRSRAPEAIQSFSTGLANVVAAAVDPKYTQTNGNNNSAFSSAFGTPGNTLSDAWASVTP